MRKLLGTDLYIILMPVYHYALSLSALRGSLVLKPVLFPQRGSTYMGTTTIATFTNCLRISRRGGSWSVVGILVLKFTF